MIMMIMPLLQAIMIIPTININQEKDRRDIYNNPSQKIKQTKKKTKQNKKKDYEKN